MPGYWMNETSGVLRPAVEAYLYDHPAPMSPAHLAAMRAYLRQWMAGDWRGPDIEPLRAAIDGIDSRAALSRWLDAAEPIGIDPL